MNNKGQYSRKYKGFTFVCTDLHLLRMRATDLIAIAWNAVCDDAMPAPHIMVERIKEKFTTGVVVITRNPANKFEFIAVCPQ